MDESIWPIFQEKHDVNKFWDRKPKQKNQIIIQNTLFRIGKKKDTQQYNFTICEEQLLYGNKSYKGSLQLGTNIFIKKVQLEEAEQDRLIAIKISRSKTLSIYIWSNNQDLTWMYFKLLAKYCISQNFEGIYQILETLDQGCLSTVFKVETSRPPKQFFAAKIYSKHILQKDDSFQIKQLILSECQVLKQLNSNCIIKLNEIIQLEDVLILIFDYINGCNLKVYLKESIDELQSSKIILQLANALKVIHDKNFVHRDIKLENIMIENQKEPKIKLIDFGFAQQINRTLLIGGQGTAGYIAPELFQQKPYTEQCDVFSLGIIYHILLIRQSPFKGSSQQAILEQNKLCSINFNQNQWKNISIQGQRLVKRLLERDPIQRISIEEFILLLESHIQKLQQEQLQINEPPKRLESHIQQEMLQVNKPSQRQITQQNTDLEEMDLNIDQQHICMLQTSQSFYNKEKWKKQ
ncbi:hypothetical protein pb186bvf_010313 [Paramecium bursaria]